MLSRLGNSKLYILISGEGGALNIPLWWDVKLGQFDWIFSLPWQYYLSLFVFCLVTFWPLFGQGKMNKTRWRLFLKILLKHHSWMANWSWWYCSESSWTKFTNYSCLLLSLLYKWDYTIKSHLVTKKSH